MVDMPPPPPNPDENLSVDTSSSEKNSAPPEKKRPLVKGTPTLVISKEEKEKYLEKRKKVPFIVHLLKYSSVLLIFISFFAFMALIFDLDLENRFLKVYGVSENLALKHKNLEEEKETAENTFYKNQAQIHELKEKLEKEEYHRFSSQIKTLKQKQLRFFDTPDTLQAMIKRLNTTAEKQIPLVLEQEYIPQTQIETILKIRENWKNDPQNQTPEGEIKPFPEEKMEELLLEAGLTREEYGVLQVPFHVAEFLTDSEGFQDLVLDNDLGLSQANDLIIENLSIDRSKLSFDVRGSNFLGHTFWLHTKFIEYMNAFPFLTNGFLTQFSKDLNENEEYEMSYRISFDIIRNEETDTPKTDTGETLETQDPLFVEFTNWHQEKKQKEVPQNRFFMPQIPRN